MIEDMTTDQLRKMLTAHLIEIDGINDRLAWLEIEIDNIRDELRMRSELGESQ